MIAIFFAKLHSRLCDTVGRQMRRIILNRIERNRLNNCDFSILSQNCVGSIWYHDLGLKFSSPTINMKFDGNDWIDFVDDFDENVNRPITFIDSDKPYPVGKIGDRFFVEFVHYHNEAEVTRKWSERKRRIRSSKVVLAFADDIDDEHIHKFMGMTQFPNRILFIDAVRANMLGLSEGHIVRFVKYGYANAKVLNFCDLLGHRFYQRTIDYVKYLNNVK